MSDSLHADPRQPSPTAVADREAKIEQLLLLGLDHYFAAEYDRAINAWTRALFLDRTHPRARAYIERARRALAERQRESEEHLQGGLDACSRGDADEARRLLQAAVDAGAPPDEALAALDRLTRPDHPVVTPVSPAPATPSTMAVQTVARQVPGVRRVPLAVVGAISVVGLAAIAGGWLAWRQSHEVTSVGVSMASPPSPVVVPRRGEIALARARRLVDSGKLHDALVALDEVSVTDPEKDDADRLRAEVQRRLFDLAGVTIGRSSEPGSSRP